jgi:hypothetical protein
LDLKNPRFAIVTEILGFTGQRYSEGKTVLDNFDAQFWIILTQERSVCAESARARHAHDCNSILCSEKIMKDIEEFFLPEPGNDFEAIPQNLNIPPWLDVNHPEFPKYFTISVYNKDGLLVHWWERFPFRQGNSDY